MAWRDIGGGDVIWIETKKEDVEIEEEQKIESGEDIENEIENDESKS